MFTFGPAARGGLDPFWANVVFLSNTSGSVVADKSSYMTAVVQSSNPPACTVAQAKWSKSALFTGTQSYITASSAGLLGRSGTDPFTIEAWYYIATASAFSAGHLGLLGAQYMEIGHSGSSRWAYANTASFGDQFNGFNLAPQLAIPLNTWTHIACCRSAGSSQIPRMFVGGIYKGSFDVQHSFDATQHQAFMGSARDPTNNNGSAYMMERRALAIACCSVG